MSLDDLARLARLIKLSGDAVIDLASMLPSLDPEEMHALGETIRSAAATLAELASSHIEESYIFDREQKETAYALTDLSGSFIGANKSFLEIVRRRGSELFGGTILEITHPQDRQKNSHLLQGLVHQRRNFTIKKRYLRPDDSTIWVENEVQRLTDDTGRELLLARCCPLIGE